MHSHQKLTGGPWVFWGQKVSRNSSTSLPLIFFNIDGIICFPLYLCLCLLVWVGVYLYGCEYLCMVVCMSVQMFMSLHVV